MNKTVTSDPLSELKLKAKEFISVQEAISAISNKLDCPYSIAAEIILSKLPDEKDCDGNSINPVFFGKKVGIATFSHCDDRPLIRSMLLSIIENDSYAYIDNPVVSINEPPMDFDDTDIPF